VTQEEKFKLAQKHAPILWLHEKEAFLPEDCKVLVEISDLYRRGQKERTEHQPGSLEDLGRIPQSEDCYLNIRDLDMQGFLVPEAYQNRIPELGPEAVSHLAREKYGYDFASSGIPADNPSVPKYYFRVSEATIDAERDDPFTRYFRDVDPGIFGKYQLIEYFLYFVFNDAWNKHESDWDSLIELYIKEDRKYMVNHFHHCKWASQWPSSSPDLRTWLKEWNSLKKNEIGKAYVINDHPYAFVALGAHGGYPTPGFTLHGLNLPGIITRDDFLANSDERPIGHLCLLPEEIDEDLIRTNLRFANIAVNKLRFGQWQEPELVENQPWLEYKGQWGENTKYLGWGGPQNPPISRPPNRNSLKEAIQSGYKSGSILNNWHGVR